MRHRDHNLRYLYGITGTEYAHILEYQGGTCAICGEPPYGKRRLSVDHCHESGHVRGLLHNTCNSALAVVERFPNPDLALAAFVQYLNFSPAVQVIGIRRVPKR